MSRNPIIRKPSTFGQQQPVPRNLMINRTIFPKTEYDPLIISQLLLKAASENNLIDIKKFIMENGITTNDMMNEDGQSILHLILLNQNLTDRQKLEMVRFLRDNNTLISSYDKLNQTPLHIASKLQLVEIVKELINAGHDVNALDVSYKTPLYYAIVGKSIEGPDVVDKPLIPKSKLKLKSTDIQDITINMVNFMNNTPNIKQFFDAQYNIFNNSQDIFRSQIYDIMHTPKINDKITEILINDKLTEQQKNSRIIEITSEVNKKVKLFLNDRLINAKKQIHLEPNTENGWGPTNMLFNKIMDKNNLTDFLDENAEELSKLKSAINDKLVTNNNKVLDLFNLINMENQILFDLNKSLLFIDTLLKSINSFGNTMPNATGQVYIDKINNIDDLLMLNNELLSYFTYDTTTNTDFDKLLYSGSLEKTESKLFDLSDNMVDGIPSGDFDDSLISDLDIDLNTILQSQIYSNEITKILKAYDNCVTHNTQYYQGAPFYDPAIPNSQFVVSIDIIMNQNPNIYSILKKYILHLKLTTKSLNSFLQNINDINNMVDLTNFISVLQKCIIDILSFTNESVLFLNEYDKLIIYFKNIKKLIESKLNNSHQIIIYNNNKGINEYYNPEIFYLAYLDKIDSFLDQYNKNKQEYPIKLFNIIKGYYDILNDIIKYTNKKSAIEVYNNYFNKFDYYTILYARNTDLIDNIMFYDISKLPDFFTSFDNFKKFITITDDIAIQKLNKTKLFQKYVIQVSQKQIYILVKNGIAIQKPMVGFISNINDYDVEVNNLSLIYGEKGNPNYSLDDNDGSKIGKYGISNALQIDKNLSFGIPIISELLDKFILTQKYIVTRYIIDSIYTYILSKIPAALPPELEELEKLRSSILSLSDNISKYTKNNPDDVSTVLIVIGKIIDKIFNENLSNIINNTTNNFGYRYNQNVNMPQYKIATITTLNKIDINDIDYDKLSSKISKLIKKNKKLFLYNIAEDVTTRNKFDKSNYKFMGSNINDEPNGLFMEFNMDILKILVKNGANLNARDKDGNTPLSIAILQSNTDAVTELLKLNVSVSTKKSKNRLGFKPLELAQKIVKTNIDNFYFEINETLTEIIKEINNDLIKSTNVNHNLRFNNIIIKMMLYILNHIWYSRINNYYNNLSKDDHDKIMSFFTDQITVLPLLESVYDAPVSYHKGVESVIDTDTMQIDKSIKDIIDIEEQQTKIRGDIGKTTIFHDDEIIDLTKKLDDKKSETQRILDPLLENPQLDKIRQKNKKDSIVKSDILNNLYQKMSLSSYPLQIYDDIVKQILSIGSYDYRTYTSLWEYLFEKQKKTKLSDSTQIIDKILGMLNTNLHNDNIVKLANAGLAVLHTDINNYFSLPIYYNDANYQLTIIMNIIIHVIKNTMMVNLYHIIIKLLRAEIELSYPQQDNEDAVDFDKRIDKLLKKVINVELNNISLTSYLFDILPEKIVKITLNIYEDDEDDDKNTNISKLLLFIHELLSANTVVPLNKDTSKTLNVLNKSIYPYFKVYLEIYIKKMKKIMDGYLSMVSNLYTKLNILDKVLVKSSME